MSYYNDSFALALEQQSYELDNMLAELDSYGSMEASGALESVQNTVAGIYDVDACGDLLDKLAGVTESYNSALEQMRDAAEMYQYTEDRQSTMEAMYPAQESLKAIYSNIVGYAPEGNVSTDMVETIHDFILGSREIIEGKMMELGGYGYAGESSMVGYGNYDDLSNYECELQLDLAFESYYKYIQDSIVKYGYAFEAETAPAENAKKQGVFIRIKNALVKFCEKWANTCRTKRDNAKNKAAKKMYDVFYGIFMRLSGQAKQLKIERDEEKQEREQQKAEKLKDDAKENVAKLQEEEKKFEDEWNAMDPMQQAQLYEGDYDKFASQRKTQVDKGERELHNQRMLRQGEEVSKNSKGEVKKTKSGKKIKDSKGNEFDEVVVIGKNTDKFNTIPDAVKKVQAEADKVSKMSPGPKKGAAIIKLKKLRTDAETFIKERAKSEAIANSAINNMSDEVLGKAAVVNESYVNRMLYLMDSAVEAAIETFDNPADLFFSMI